MADRIMMPQVIMVVRRWTDLTVKVNMDRKVKLLSFSWFLRTRPLGNG